MIVHIRPRDRAEVADGGFDACLFLEFHHSVQGERGKVIGRAMRRELPCGGASVLANKEELKLAYVVARHAELQVPRELKAGAGGLGRGDTPCRGLAQE